MPRTKLLLYRDEDGTIPVLEWLERLPQKAQDKCFVRIERLQELGHELRRPEADILRDGIYELRTHHQHVNYRILYFFFGRSAIVMAHGITKEGSIPSTAIKTACEIGRAHV